MGRKRYSTVTQTQVQTKKGVYKLHYPLTNGLLGRAEAAGGRMKGWPKLALRHLRGKLRPGLVATGPYQFVKAPLGRHRFALGQVRTLVSQKSR